MRGSAQNADSLPAMTTFCAHLPKCRHEFRHSRLERPLHVGARHKSESAEVQEARDCAQKSSNLLLNRQQRRAMMALAPRTVQNMPDCLRRTPTMDLQPASITPEPTKKPCCRNSGYRIRGVLVSK